MLKINIIVLLLLIWVFSAQAGATNMIITTMSDPETNKATLTIYLKKLLEQRSSGRIRVTIKHLPGATADDLVKTLQEGTAHIAIPEIDKLDRQAVPLKILELPFLYKNRHHLHQVLDSNIGQSLLSRLEEENLKLLGIWDKGTIQIAGKKEWPMEKSLFFEDDPDHCCFPKNNFTAETSGPQQPTGFNKWQELTLEEILENKAHFAFSDITMTNHRYSAHALLVGEPFWAALPDDIKVITRDAIFSATNYAAEMAEQSDRDSLSKLRRLKDIRIHMVSASTRHHWKEQILQHYKNCCGLEVRALVAQTVY